MTYTPDDPGESMFTQEWRERSHDPEPFERTGTELPVTAEDIRRLFGMGEHYRLPRPWQRP